GFGLKIGKTNPNRFGLRVEELVAGHPTLEIIGKALLAAHEVLLRELNGFEKRVRQQARQDERVRLVMSAPGVGPIVGLTYVAAIDDPARFTSSKQVGPHFGLTPKRYQSGETDYSGRISKIGDVSVRTALYEAANAILTKPLKGATALKSWGMKWPSAQAWLRRRWHLRASWASSCIACGSMERDLSTEGALSSLPPLSGEREQRLSGGSRHQPSRSEVPSPGRWKGSDRIMLRDGDDHAQSDCSASSSSNPIRWRS